jgi:hypothetical protein
MLCDLCGEFYSPMHIVFSRRMSDEELPAINLTLSFSSTNLFRSAFQYASCRACSTISTVPVFPGCSAILLNPFSSLSGLSTDESMCLTYYCTTSSPARLPVFLILTLTKTESPSVMTESETERSA